MRFVRLWFTDVLGFLKSVEITPGRARGRPRGGHDLRRLDHRGLQPDPGIRHARQARPQHVRAAARAATATRRSRGCSATSQVFSGDPFDGDPRYVLKRNLERAREKGFTFFVGPEMEFFYFRTGGAGRAARQRRLLRPHRARPRLPAAQADGAPPRGDGHPGRVLVPRERAEPARDRPALHRRARRWPTT